MVFIIRPRPRFNEVQALPKTGMTLRRSEARPISGNVVPLLIVPRVYGRAFASHREIEAGGTYRQLCRKWDTATSNVREYIRGK